MLASFGALARRVREHCRSERGNLTAITSIAAVPVIAAAGIAIDLGRMSRVQDQLQTIADGAALAAASARNLSGSSEQVRNKRAEIAESFLSAGLADLTDIESVEEPSVTATASSVSVSIGATVKGSLSNVLNLLPNGEGPGNRFRIAANSEADWVYKKEPICILALNKTSEQSLEIQGTADIIAKDCSVRVNSASNRGLLENGTASLTASTICVHGPGYVGEKFFRHYVQDGKDQFEPIKPRMGCKQIEDPFKNKFSTDDYAKIYANAKENQKGSGPKQLVVSSGKLWPGLYVGGIQIKAGASVVMQPGVYIIENGKFEVQNATLTSDVNNDGRLDAASEGVTIILTDTDAATKVTTASQTRIDFQAQADVSLVAPASGLFAGIVIAQHPNSITAKTKSAANSIIGGGKVALTGTVYYPTNILYITGGGTGTYSKPEQVATSDPLFSIVADKIYVEGNGQLNVGGNGDSVAAGLPPLPITDEGTAVVTLQ
ncbi:pilus assembly protein TadG-related protein [Aestuariivirga sp.]|uniref:pilus assembly protein TadG-related protein n=1 Tax=Aestuariivirga sp. TaxID=2650926 RepID=UPI00391B4682